MNMNWIDWAIVSILLLSLIGMVNYTRKYIQSVADFLAANRCAGRYMIALAGNMSSLGAIGIMAWFEMYYKAGFTAAWWTMMTLPVATIISLTGWVVYRYRETRVMTMAEFFEIRYSKRFRVFTGMLAFVSGIINFGIFPSVGARFFIYFCGLPNTISIWNLSISTYPLVMIILLSIALYFVFSGGQIAIMVTDFIQGIFCYIVFIAIPIYLMFIFDWTQISKALLMAPQGASLVHPFQASDVPDFDVWYFLIFLIGMFYSFMSWQGSQGYNCCAISPHEQKMGRILGAFREMTGSLLFVCIPVCAYTLMNNPDFSQTAATINQILAHIENGTIREQLLVPVAAATFLGKGLLGCLCAVMLAAFITTNDTYLHSWGSIFIQDVWVPLQKKPLRQDQHIKLLRWSIFGVAVFAFFWSLVFRLNEAIFLYMAITGAIYMGGAGAVIVGGLYWKRGTTTAAWWTMIVGAIFAISGLVIRQIYPDFPINSQWLFFWNIIISCTLYVTISLLGKRVDFDLDRMLHRGKYDASEGKTLPQRGVFSAILERLGVDKEFTREDKWIYGLCLGWSLFWFGIFIIGTLYNMFFNANVSDKSWLQFWYIWVLVSLVAGVIVTIWFTIFGIRDMKRMFKRLSLINRDESDDGTIVAGNMTGYGPEKGSK